MTILLPTLAIAFAAFCVWLAVRIFNRRERWAKWTLAATLASPVLYVASFGPACWSADRKWISPHLTLVAYRPLAVVVAHSCPDRICDAATDYGMWGSGNPGFPTALILIATERTKVGLGAVPH